jgi:hypothetical protein
MPISWQEDKEESAMSRFSSCIQPMTGFAFLLVFQSSNLQAEERTREFPALYCRYTLPGEEWNWSRVTASSNVFLATDGKGHVVTLASLQVPKSTKLDGRFVQELEKSLYEEGKFKKRGGRFQVFLGRPCYQFELEMADGNTGAGRVVLANGMSYQLMVIGNKGPIELDPEFEKIMGGFAFTGSPILESADRTSQSDQAEGEVATVSRFMGSLAVWCLLAAAAIALVTWAIRKLKSQRHSDQG